MIDVRWLGHSTVVIDLDGTRVLTDPLLRNHVGLLRRVTPPPRAADWSGVDAILLSHLHLDHADVASLRLLPETPVLASANVANWLSDRGIGSAGISSDWQRIPGSGATEVRLVPAEHHARPLPGRPIDAHGFLLRCPSGTVWFAGDTADYPEMEHLAEWAGGRIDVVLLPIHGWGPRLSAGHLDAVGAAKVCRVVRPRFVVPIHYGTLHAVGLNLRRLDWMHSPAELFASSLTAVAPDTSLVQLAATGPGWQLPAA
ncbi:MBL fold metallo-hydrolase [Branchiibius sp. NY16-3462-2]|uniref:MBL fold metallo-hydrolase n=1 Tax=Branchiibius sp. NY16-3462-2 TaxID=1807500 RepID=UPI0025BE86B7|nr:MBL fold metallo-hydrolase [Branchiibius sp. NY16-3462-2]